MRRLGWGWVTDRAAVAHRVTWRKNVSGTAVLREKPVPPVRPLLPQWGGKPIAPAETEVPVSAASGVEQSHNQLAWEVMLFASRASIFSPCHRPARRRVLADA